MAKLTRAAILAEACRPEDFIGAKQLALPESIEPLLSEFSKEKALALLEEPPMNRMEHFFEPHREDLSPDPSATIIQLLEILIGCGHAKWVAEQLPSKHPRVWVLAALSGHPLLLATASQLFEMPVLERCVERLQKDRQTLDDLLVLADASVAHPRFRAALADAISTYCLTCDASDSLMEPMAWFQGFERAAPGKLCYFFIRAPADYPIFWLLWQKWATDTAPPWGDSAAMLYTTCYHYRAAVVGEALLAQHDPAHRESALKLTSEIDEQVSYFQDGSPARFNRDTLKMAQRLLGSLEPLKPESTPTVAADDYPDAAKLIELLVANALIRLRASGPPPPLLKDLTRLISHSASPKDLSEFLVEHPAVDELFATDEELERLLSQALSS